MSRAQEIENEIESLIDATDLDTVLEAIEAVCWGKAEHLESNWQDRKAAKVWERDAKSVSKCISECQKH